MEQRWSKDMHRVSSRALPVACSATNLEYFSRADRCGAFSGDSRRSYARISELLV